MDSVPQTTDINEISGMLRNSYLILAEAIESQTNAGNYLVNFVRVMIDDMKSARDELLYAMESDMNTNSIFKNSGASNILSNIIYETEILIKNYERKQ